MTRADEIGPIYWISVADEIIQEDWTNLFWGWAADLGETAAAVMLPRSDSGRGVFSF